MDTIRTALKQCRYAQNLENLLKPESGFQVLNNKGEVILVNYQSIPPLEPPFQGVCNDLTFQVGSYLKKKLGDGYVIQAGLGSSDAYFSRGSHIYLLAWPKSKDMQVRLGLALDKTNLPTGCLLIDPSFNHIATHLHGYRLKQVSDLQILEPTSNNKYFALPKRAPLCPLPMGFVNDLFPEKTEKYGDKAMVFLNFKMDEPGLPELEPMIQASPDAQEFVTAHDLLEDAPETHPFPRFVNRVKADLARPETEEQLIEIIKYLQQISRGPLPSPTDDGIPSFYSERIFPKKSLLADPDGIFTKDIPPAFLSDFQAKMAGLFAKHPLPDINFRKMA